MFVLSFLVNLGVQVVVVFPSWSIRTCIIYLAHVTMTLRSNVAERYKWGTC